jgi:CelD/BcsL family acetyltransferase involved in cellulose biosynthesis
MVELTHPGRPWTEPRWGRAASFGPAFADRSHAAARDGAWRSELVDPLADGRWDAFVGSAPSAGAFHHRGWLELLVETFAYPVTACCIVDRAGTVLAGAPVALVPGMLRRPRLVSLPFSDHCAPLPSTAEGPILAQRLAGALDDLRTALGLGLELRGTPAPLPSASVVAHYHRHDIPLEPDVDAVVRRFRRRSQILRAVRRTEREGLVVERRTDARALAAFYAMHARTRRRLGVPTHPKRFILGLARLFDRGLGFVMLVRDGDRPIAGAVFLTFNGSLIYKYGASETWALPKRPNNLLFLEAIRWGCEAGMQTLDLGRTDIGHEGLREFKLGWGAEERALDYVQLADGEPRVRGAGLARRAAPVIRRSPPIVTRLIGEACYRHAG